MSENSEFFERIGTNVKGGEYRRGSQAHVDCAPSPIVPAVPGRAPGDVRNTGEKRWAANHEVFWGATQTYDELPAGLYRCGVSNDLGPILIRMEVETDSLLLLPDMATARIVEEFRRFWEVAHEFRARGFIHKRGFLLWGPPGSGKTSCLQLLIKTLIEDHGGIILFVENPTSGALCMQMARKIESHRPMIVVLEDIDAIIEKSGESELLALLDGESQVDNVVFVGSTNYPERLDRRFVDRPSRFDTISYLPMPSAAARRAYFLAKEPGLSENELESWVDATDGLSIAHLKELIIAVRCFGQPLHGPDGVVERLQMMSSRPSSERAPDRNGAGFLGNANIALLGNTRRGPSRIGD